MRNKKIFTTIIFALIVFAYSLVSVRAESYKELEDTTFDMDHDIVYEDPVCTNNDEDGNYTIKWDTHEGNHGKLIMGAINATCTKYKEGTPKSFPYPETLYDSQSEAQSAINQFLSWTQPKCCKNTDPKEGDMCAGSSICTQPTCSIEEVTVQEVDDVKWNTGTCKCTYLVENDETRLPERQEMDGSCSNKGECTCGTGGTASGSCEKKVIYKDVKKYKVPNCTKPVLEVDSTYQCERNIYTYYYKMDIDGTDYDDDDVYCVQPGASGPGEDGLPYKLNTDFDISKCKDQFTTYSGGRAVYCGLAHIMYQAYNVNPDTLEFTTFKSSEYTHAAVTLALRLWMAAYGSESDGPGLGGGENVEEGEDSDSVILGWIPKENYYDDTANAIKNKNVDKDGKLPYDTSNSAVSGYSDGRIGCAESDYGDTPPRCVIDQAIELFHNTEIVTKEDYLGGINFNKSSPIVEIIDDSRDIKITWDDEDSIERIKTDCNDFNDPKCIIEPHAYVYKDGREIDVTDLLKIEKDFCTKNFCRFKPKGLKEVCFQYGTKVKVVLVFKNWYQTRGEMKFYTESNDASKYQVMMSMGVQLNQCYKNGKGVKTGRVVREIGCDCPPNKCTDLTSNISYETDTVCNPKTTVSDASMNCIANACDPITVADYDVTSEYDVDPQVCTIYEREENDLYTPGAVSVYSGMQFSYDLAKDLAKRGINTKSSKKLTSVIIQKKQITAKINYSYWLSEYNKKLILLQDAFGEHKDNYSNAYRASLKQDINNWISELENCNMYSGTELITQMNNKVAALADCKDASCNAANVAIEYKSATGEKKYGEKQTLAVERHRLESLDNQYYCHGSNCYNYNANTSFTEPNMPDHKVSLDYYNCTNSCSKTTRQIPDNTYATKVYNIEHDYYNDKKYYVNAYTGNVSTSSSGEDISTPLADYSYPISGNTKTSISGYPIQFYFTELSNKKLKGYSTTSSCLIKVYNRTTAYDCKTTNSKGNTDLSNCEDNKYNIVNGIPIINDNQIEWTSTNKKQYGFVARFIDLDNPFPNGLDNRTSIINWTTDDVEEIKKTANDIFTNSEYLEYSYVLTPTAIKEIKEYNKNQVDAGGYQNQTLEDCKVIKDESGLSTFTECRSTFLHGELRKYDGVEISGNKAGAY